MSLRRFDDSEEALYETDLIDWQVFGVSLSVRFHLESVLIEYCELKALRIFIWIENWFPNNHWRPNIR